MRGVCQESLTALREKDADRIVGVYAPEIVIFSLAPPLQETPLQETGSRVAGRRPVVARVRGSGGQAR